jgi:hypothetical protein
MHVLDAVYSVQPRPCALTLPSRTRQESNKQKAFSMLACKRGITMHCRACTRRDVHHPPVPVHSQLGAACPPCALAIQTMMPCNASLTLTLVVGCVCGVLGSKELGPRVAGSEEPGPHEQQARILLIVSCTGKHYGDIPVCSYAFVRRVRVCVGAQQLRRTLPLVRIQLSSAQPSTFPVALSYSPTGCIRSEWWCGAAEQWLFRSCRPSTAAMHCSCTSIGHFLCCTPEHVAPSILMFTFMQLSLCSRSSTSFMQHSTSQDQPRESAPCCAPCCAPAAHHLAVHPIEFAIGSEQVLGVTYAAGVSPLTKNVSMPIALALDLGLPSSLGQSNMNTLCAPCAMHCFIRHYVVAVWCALTFMVCDGV